MKKRPDSQAKDAATSDNEITLNSGYAIPRIGFDTYQLEQGNPTTEAVAEAVAVGYRLLSCVRYYGNEKNVGDTLEEITQKGAPTKLTENDAAAKLSKSGIPRASLFITSKV